METPALESDVWSEWLLHHRHADDPAYGRVVQAAVERYADRVLQGTQLAAGMTLVDVASPSPSRFFKTTLSTPELCENASRINPSRIIAF
jgi:hypothetical protein